MTKFKEQILVNQITIKWIDSPSRMIPPMAIDSEYPKPLM